MIIYIHILHKSQMLAGVSVFSGQCERVGGDWIFVCEPSPALCPVCSWGTGKICVFLLGWVCLCFTVHYYQQLMEVFILVLNSCSLHLLSAVALIVHFIQSLRSAHSLSHSQILYSTHKSCNDLLLTAGENPTFLDFGASFPRFY